MRYGCQANKVCSFTAFGYLQLAAGQCNTFGTVEGNSAHPEGFCQLTCNHCNNYCVPKNGKSVPAAPTTSSGSSSSSSSGSCSDNPPSKQYSCAQQVRAIYHAVCSRLMVSHQKSHMSLVNVQGWLTCSISCRELSLHCHSCCIVLLTSCSLVLPCDITLFGMS